MILRKFITGVVIRLILLFACMAALALILWNADFLFTQLVLVSLFGLLLAEFFRYITKTNRDLSKFIFAIRHQDYSVSFNSYKLGSAFEELHASFREMLDIYRANKLEKEEQFQLIQNIVNKLPVGLVVSDSSGTVLVCNEQALRLLRVSGLSTIERLDKFHSGLSKTLKDLPLEVLSDVGDWQVKRSKLRAKSDFDVFVFQNLKEHLEGAEMDAWLKLIRVLTHEIMNSITSVSSLSATAKELSSKTDAPAPLTEALESIHKRSKGMIAFVEDYRRLTNVPAPRKSWFDLVELCKEQVDLLSKEQPQVNIRLANTSGKFNVYADSAQIAQVLINVLLNAQHGVERSTEPQILISFEKSGKHTSVSIKDNGKGIPPEELNQVFTPFYTTRSNGSGIGLSLCRQIMRNHGGSISIESKVGEGTRVGLRFKA